MNANSPLLLQAQISPPPTGGSFGLADTTRLENPFQAPMWIDEVRIRLPDPTGVTLGNSSSNLRVELELGSYSLTNGFVPIALLGKVLNDSYLGGPSLENTAPGFFTWKFAKPLFCPARQLLRPTFYIDPYPGAQAQVVTIAYACRPLPRDFPTPKVLQIPWVTYFMPPFLACPGATDSISHSQPSDIFNPFEVDLHVERFLGRLLVQGAGGGDFYMDLASANVNVTTGLVSIGTLITAQDSMNNILIRDRTPFAHVFDFIDRAWTVNCILPSKGFYLFTVERLWSAYSATVTATTGISMVGWREVVL